MVRTNVTLFSEDNNMPASRRGCSWTPWAYPHEIFPLLQGLRGVALQTAIARVLDRAVLVALTRLPSLCFDVYLQRV